jgi:CBS domain-containing protein
MARRGAGGRPERAVAVKSGPAAQTIAALRGHAPFDEMDADSLRFLAERLALAYYARSSVVTGPQAGAADRLYIIKQGRVHGADILDAGECFPLGALVRRGPAAHEYRAEGDVFCWELPAADFHALLARSPPFHAFCTNHLAALLGRARPHEADMLAPLRSVLARPPVSCAPGTPIREVLLAMRAQRIGSMVVAGADRIPLGIFTTVDVLEKVAAPQASVEAPVSSVMTPRPLALEEDATLADAAIAMARHGIRHVVVTRDGKLTGVVSERDLFALQRVSLRRTAERIQLAGTAAELAEAAADIRDLARHLLAHGTAAEPLTAMVSALNDALTHRLIELLSKAHALTGRWCWMALGSEGRREQTFVTDQDNALIFDGAQKERLLAFADEVNRALDAAGFPLCKGDIMARNQRWCLPAEEWRAVFDGWIRNPHPEALLNASIFFDFRPLAGEARLAGELREAVLAQARANRSFLRALTESALQGGPPLGWLKDFSTDQLDLKGSGARPFVDAARVLALAEGVGETGTAARLRARGEAGAADAFHFIQGLRLRHGNRVSVAVLSALERRVLKEAFRESARLQSRIRMDFGL